MKFYGFDSFEGFGSLEEVDEHPFYTDVNFSTNYQKVYARINKLVNDNNFLLVKGFFDDTLTEKCITDKSRIIFIDSDTYSSAKMAIEYTQKSIQEGTIIILDDYYSYKGSLKKGVAGAIKEFSEKQNITLRQIDSYGMGGVIVIVSKIK